MENRLRRLLRLPSRPDGWLAPGLRSKDIPGTQYSELVQLDPEQTRQEQEQEAREGWRGRWAGDLARSPWAVRRKSTDFYHHIHRRLEHRRALQEIGGTRWLHFQSPFILETGYCQEVEGSLYASQDHQLPFCIIAQGSLDQEIKLRWAEGEVFQDQAVDGTIQIIVPVKHLTQEDVLRALRHWYIGRYGKDPLHWSAREGHLPNMYLHLRWQDWREYDSLWLPEESKEWEDQDYRKYRTQSLQHTMRKARATRKELYRQFDLD